MFFTEKTLSSPFNYVCTMDLKHFSEKTSSGTKRYVKLKISLVSNPPPSLPKYLRQIPLDPTELYSAVRTLPITASESGEKNMI